jgi:hypothetical protein
MTMEEKQKQYRARVLSVAFVAVIGVILTAILLGVALTPYDSGVLVGASLSGNNQYGGEVSASKDYLFYVKDGSIMRETRFEDQPVQKIFEGEVTHLNPYDGWLYFLQDGKMMRIAYYGGPKVQIGTAHKVTKMSVNGLWIYYLDEQGRIGKVRTDGEKETLLTDGKIAFTAFESANRIILATDGKGIYSMKTDGSQQQLLVDGTNISRMVYTLDSLYYCDNGQVKEIRSVEAGRDDGTHYQGVTAEIFTYNTDQNGRGQIFYVADGKLQVRLLESVEHEKEENRVLYEVKDITDLYSVDGDLYYHDSKNVLYHVQINDAECTVEPVK